jgi:hypothetical protein
MKKIILVFITALFYIETNAQISVGGYTMFPDRKLAGSFYKPQLSFASINGDNYLVLLFTDSKAYKTFDNNCRLLLKFEDGSIARLPIDLSQGVVKDYDSMSDDFGLARFYITYTCYPIGKHTINKILNEEKIIKIRIGLPNGNVLDYDISKKYQLKLVKGLAASHIATQALNKLKEMQATDENF